MTLLHQREDSYGAVESGGSVPLMGKVGLRAHDSSIESFSTLESTLTGKDSPLLDEEDQSIVVDVQRTQNDPPQNEEVKTPLPRTSCEWDSFLLERAICDAGANSFGIQAIEAWVLNDDRNRLFMPPGGLWLNPIYDGGCGGLEALKKLEDPNHSNYEPPQPVMLGCGLAGNLWLESSKVRSGSGLVWRHVESILNDPDRPWDPRLSALVEAGLGLATAVPFDIEGTKGIIVFLARASASLHQLGNSPNERFIRCTATHIGAVIALSSPRRQIIEFKSQMRERVARMAMKKIKIARLFMSLGYSKPTMEVRPTERANEENTESTFDLQRLLEVAKTMWNPVQSFVSRKASMVKNKSKGGSMKPPPPMSWRQSFWTFFGVSLTLLVITLTSNIINIWSNGLYGIAYGPIGALMALQFGLSSAPASQPRNVMYGQAVAGTMSLLLTRGMAAIDIPLDIRIPVATAAGIAAMCKLGLCHPPGGGFAIVLSTGKVGWIQFLLLLFASGIAVVMSTLINNLDEDRQYPHYWHVESTFSIPALLSKFIPRNCLGDADRNETETELHRLLPK